MQAIYILRTTNWLAPGLFMLGWLHLASSGESGLKTLSEKPAECLWFQLLQCFRHFMSLFWGRERNHSWIHKKEEKCIFLTLKLDDTLRIHRNKTEFILQVRSAMSWIAYQQLYALFFPQWHFHGDHREYHKQAVYFWIKCNQHQH